MAGQASDYHRGEMDIQEQVSTFQLVMGITKWGSLIVAVGVLFFTLLFCTQVGLISAAISAAVVAVVGVMLLGRGGGGH